MLVCTTPTTVPITIVAAAITQITWLQSSCIDSNEVRKTRANAAKAAALTPVDMKPVTGGGAPS